MAAEPLSVRLKRAGINEGECLGFPLAGCDLHHVFQAFDHLAGTGFYSWHLDQDVLPHLKQFPQMLRYPDYKGPEENPDNSYDGLLDSICVGAANPQTPDYVDTEYEVFYTTGEEEPPFGGPEAAPASIDCHDPAGDDPKRAYYQFVQELYLAPLAGVAKVLTAIEEHPELMKRTEEGES